PGAGMGSSVRTYIVENVQGTPMAAVHFSDGYVVENIPARSVYAVTVTRSGSGGPVVSTVTNTYAIPTLSSGGAAPPPGGGTNLYPGYSPDAPAPIQKTGTIEPMSPSPPTSPGVIPITAPRPDGSSPDTFNYPYATPYVWNFSSGPAGFAGSVLPTNATSVSFQTSHVSGTYIPGQDTSFQLVFKAPLGQINHGKAGSVLMVAAQVIYQLNDAQNTQYVETFPMANLSFIGGIATYTSSTLGTPPVGTKVPGNPLWSGVVAATRTVGQPRQIDRNLFFAQYDAGVPGNVNLSNPLNDQNDTSLDQIRNRTVQLASQPFTMTNGTVTLVVYI